MSGPSPDSPAWAPRSFVLGKFCLPRRRLTELVGDGVVRSVKFCDHKSARRLFNVGDVEQALNDLAMGREPGRPRRKATRRIPQEAAAS